MTPTLRLSVKYTSNVTCQITLIGDEKKKTVKIVRLAKKKKKEYHIQLCFIVSFAETWLEIQQRGPGPCTDRLCHLTSPQD